MKKHLLSILFFSIPLLIFAEIKDAICIVEPKYSKATLEAMQKSAKFFKEEYYDDISEEFKEKELKRFGSGFFYKHSDNSVYIITNAHVINNADFADITIEHSNGQKTQIKDSEIIAVQPEFDMAVLAVPKNTKINETLEIVSVRPKDGSEIWSAGYPSLGNEPSWQLGKGTITNRMTKINELVNPEKITLLQHSAPVDPGNSGGPLLIKTENALGYAVVGINTWKAFFRQSANFAMPAEAIKDFIGEALNKTEDSHKKQSLYNRLDDLFGLFSDYNRKKKDSEQIIRDRKITRYISDSFDVKQANKLLLDILQTARRDVRKEALYLCSSTPVDALKFSIAYNLENTMYESADKPSISKEDFDKNVKISGNTAAILIGLGEKAKVHFEFKYEKNSWLLTSYNQEGKLTANKTKNQDDTEDEDSSGEEESGKAKSYKIEAPYLSLILLDYSFESDSEGGKVSGFDINYSYSFKYAALGGFVGFGFPHSLINSNVKGEGLLAGLRSGVFIQGQVPFKFSKTFTLMPYADFRLLLKLSQQSGSFLDPCGSFGLGVNVKLGKNTAFVISTGYRFTVNFKNSKQTVHAVHIGAGLGF